MDILDFHDPVSSWSHLLMSAWSVFACAFLLRLAARHTRSQRAGLLFYTVAVVSLYAASGLFHGIQHTTPAGKRVWQLLDQTAIFSLILGSNVPIVIYVLPRRLRTRLLALMGGFAVVGITALWALPKPPHMLLVFTYIGMGVLGLLPMREYFRRLGWGGMKWVFLLAFFYVLGGVFEAMSWPVIVPGWFGYHELLHFCDMLGTLAHYALLLRIVTATPPVVSRRRPTYPADFLLTPGENRTKL